MKRTLTFATTALLVTAATPSSPPSSPADQYLAQYVDASVSPRDDFFRYAVGKWLKDHPSPANERSWGISHVVQEETYRRVVAINEESAANTQVAKGSNAQKIGDFWFAAMDTATILKQGFTPLDMAMGKSVTAQLPVPHESTVALLKKLGAKEGPGRTALPPAP